MSSFYIGIIVSVLPIGLRVVSSKAASYLQCYWKYVQYEVHRILNIECQMSFAPSCTSSFSVALHANPVSFAHKYTFYHNSLKLQSKRLCQSDSVVCLHLISPPPSGSSYEKLVLWGSSHSNKIGKPQL